MPQNKEGNQNLILTVHAPEGIRRQLFPSEDRAAAFDAWSEYIKSGIYALLMPNDADRQEMTDAEIADEALIELKALMTTVSRISHNLQGRHLPCQATLLKIGSLTQVAIDELETPAGADQNEWF